MAQQYPQDFEMIPPPAPPARKRSGLITAACVVLLVLAASVIVNETLLKIGPVSVIGNRAFSWQEVILAAGLDRPVSYFGLNEKKLAQSIESNRYLIFEKVEKHFPNGLTLYIRERTPAARVQEMGADYYLDDQGMVLERGSTPKTYGGDGVVIVTGLKPKELRVGRRMTAGTTEHMRAYLELLEELQKQGWLDQISELNITDPESIYLVTRDGFSARLGDLDSLRAKIGTVRAVVARLREMGKAGGMLEAGKPGEAIYTPPNL